jgi:putative colanic acid biosynthesis acetyltransferase WcaF
LRLFGASVATSATIRPSADIFYPWNVQIGAYSYIGDAARLYSLDRIIIGSHVSISMGATICAGTHDYRNSEFPLVIKPVVIENEAWIAAEAFLGPGVHVRRGAVIGARAVVSTGAVGEGEVWVGHPARLLKRRCSELAIK